MAKIVELVQRGYDGGGYPKYVVLVHGKYFGDIYYNMTGYAGYLPLPPTAERKYKIGNLDIGEVGISKFKREISGLNKEWADFEKTKRNPRRRKYSVRRNKHRYARKSRRNCGCKRRSRK